MNCGTDCSGNPITYSPWINTTYVVENTESNNCKNNCEPVCEGPVGPVTIPVFNTTYVGRSTRHYPRSKIDYYDCKKQRGGTCGTSNNIASNTFKDACSVGRCELTCDPNFYTKTQEEQEEIMLTKKTKINNHNSNYIGTSKKMAYGKYARTTPGLETFASKKVASLQPLVKKKQDCFIDYTCGSL